jgi:glycerol dehydrogenase-like iron-containing ADH family enzyme
MLEIKVPQRYLNLDGVTAKVGEYIAPLAQQVLIVTSPSAWKATRDQVEYSLQEQGIGFQLSFLSGPCSESAVNAIAQQASLYGAQLILGIGGGRVMDAAKAAGEKLQQLPVINLPTIAATCAAWSPISVIYNDHGGQIGPLTLQRLPVWVLVDSQVIAQSDSRYLQAGIVDALAKWYEFQPYLRQGDQGLSLLLKAQPARLALDTFISQGQQAVKDNQNTEVTPALRQVIDAVIALAGLANSMRDEIPRVGIAHAIHNSMTHIEELHHWLHGEKVGFGLAVQALLESDHAQTREELLPLLKIFGSPLSLSYQGNVPSANLGQQIAQRIHIAPSVIARLPFPLDQDRIASAIETTLNQYRPH